MGAAGIDWCIIYWKAYFTLPYRFVYNHQEIFIDSIVNGCTCHFVSLFHRPAVDKLLMLKLYNKNHGFKEKRNFKVGFKLIERCRQFFLFALINP